MTLKKAIETTQSRLDETESYIEIEERDALLLLIGAGKRIDHCRRWSSSTWGSPLPGETEDYKLPDVVFFNTRERF